MTEARKREDATVDLPPSQDGMGQTIDQHARTAEFPSSAPQNSVPSANDAVNPVDTAKGGLDENSETIDHPPSNAQVADTLDRAATNDDNGAFSLAQGIGPVDAPPPNGVAGYEILQVLGRGAMGVVYKARHIGLKRVVALKMILAGKHAGDEELARFRTEAEAAAQLQHPNIVQVYDVGLEEGSPYLALEFIEGGSLQARIDNTPQPILPTAQTVQVLAEAMDFAHKKGIIHRDLKPANIMLTQPRAAEDADTVTHSSITALVEETYGTPKIADFGLAKQCYREDTGQTRSGAILGTPSYMAPEQAEGRTREVGPLADQYALGAMLYELLTGRPPFRGATVMETLEQVRSQEPVPPSRLQPKVPRDLETICLKALSKETRKRYADCAALAEDLRRFVSSKPILARPVGPAQRIWRWCRRNPVVATASAAILLLLLVVSVGSTWAAFTIRAEKELAEKNELIAKEQKALAEENEQKARTSEKLAEDQAELALNTLGLLINKVQSQLRKQPGAQQLKRDLLQTAMNGLRQVTGGGAGKMRRYTSDAYFKMGGIAKELGNSTEASEYWKRYYEMAQTALNDNPENEHLKLEMAWACRFLGEMSLEMGDLRKALSYHQSALALRQELAAVPLEERMRRNEKLAEEDRLTPRLNSLQLSEEYTRLGMIHYFLGESAQAEEPVSKSLALRENLVNETARDHAVWFMAATPATGPTVLSVAASIPGLVEQVNEMRLDLARNYHLLGEVSFRIRNPKQARVYYQKCENIRETILRADEIEVERLKQIGKSRPPDFRLMSDLAEFYQMYGALLFSLGAPVQEVLPKIDRAITLSRKVLEIDKGVEPQQNLAKALYSRGVVAAHAGDRTMARECLRECLETRQQLADKDVGNYSKKLDLLEVLARAGKYERAAELAEKLRPGHQKDPTFLIGAACCFAQCSLAVSDNSTLRQQYLETALAALDTALEHGYKDIITLETNPDLDPVREMPAFKKLLEKVVKSTASSGVALNENR